MRAKLLLPALALCLSAGCRATAPLPPADFSAPGWTVQTGQAVWHPPGRRPELAGDLLLATNANGNCYLQFTKLPFPVVSARIQGGEWQIDFGTEHHWRGRGAPPEHFAWLVLPKALLGAPPGGAWQFSTAPDESWRLRNPRSGETLEGVFPP